MSKKKVLGLLGLGVLLVAAIVYLSNSNIPVLQPQGEIGQKERHLMIIGGLLAIIVVAPTFTLAIYIAMKYREDNHRKSPKKIAYDPDFDHSRLFEGLWWGIPIVIIGILSVITWQSSHALDPYKPITSTQKPLNVQVVALDWKWLFIYPEQGIASVNLAEIPTGTSVDFHVTSDSIMNSFWVPALGGQIYAMPGMDTQLHELTNKAGDYFGSPANIAGKGFSRMNFTIRAASSEQFNAWVKNAKNAPQTLTGETYQALAKPSQDVPVNYYASVQSGLYDDILMKYMAPSHSASTDGEDM